MKPGIPYSDTDHMDRSLARWLGALSESTDEEICGFIYDDWSFFRVRNSHVEPKDNFSFDPNGYMEGVNNEKGIIGIFHSHPGGRLNPSQNDIAGWPRTNKGRLRYWITNKHGVAEWKVNDGTLALSLEWKYIWGPEARVAESVLSGTEDR